MPATGEDRPNVVLVYTDDQDQQRVGCYGAPVPTPNVDRLAEEGVRFDRFYVSSPICAPSRYTTLTGRYAGRSPRLHAARPPDAHANVGFEPGIYGDPHNVARVLADHGYETGMIGKWHQGLAAHPDDDDRLEPVAADADGRDPSVDRTIRENYRTVVEAVEDCGFDHAGSVYATNPAGLELPDEMRHHNMDWVTRGAVEFVEANRDGPFFLYLAPTLTHGPWGLEQLATDPRSTPAGHLEDAPAVQPSRESVRERARESGLIRGRRGHGFEVGADAIWLDDGIGAVLDALDRLGIAEDTLVLFASDNGDVSGKGTCYDAGARMPFLARWPGGFDAREPCDRLVSNVDLVPTILDAAGVDPGPDYRVDGRSLLPLLAGEGEYERDSVYLEVYRNQGRVPRGLTPRVNPDTRRPAAGEFRPAHRLTEAKSLIGMSKIESV